MDAQRQIDAEEAPGNRRPGLAPAITLIVFAPGIAEVLSGATRLSFIFVLIPEMMVWGCGALLIREVVRRWQGGWTSMLLLGLGLSVAEEFVIQQTSLAPLPWVNVAAYGRAWGVNWIFFLFMLVYESVWVVLVPVQLTELIFASRRKELWLKRAGLIVCSVIFIVGSFMAWFMWTQVARTKVFHAAPYQPPELAIFSGVVIIAILASAAYTLRNIGGNKLRDFSGAALRTSRQAPSPWVVGAVTLLLGFPWYLLMTLIFGPPRDIALWMPMAVGILWAALAYYLIRRWASAFNWSDLHRWSLVFSAALVCMIAGFLGSGLWPRADLVAKAILNVIAVVGFVWLGLKISGTMLRGSPNERVE